MITNATAYHTTTWLVSIYNIVLVIWHNIMSYLILPEDIRHWKFVTYTFSNAIICIVGVSYHTSFTAPVSILLQVLTVRPKNRSTLATIRLITTVGEGVYLDKIYVQTKCLPNYEDKEHYKLVNPLFWPTFFYGIGMVHGEQLSKNM